MWFYRHLLLHKYVYLHKGIDELKIMTIANNQELSITQSQIMRLETFVQQLNLQQLDKGSLPEWLYKAQTDGLNSLIDQLKVEVDRYAETHDLGSICKHCGKDNWDFPDLCKRPTVFSPGVGDWVCLLNNKEGF